MDRMEYTQAVATMRVYEKRLLDSVKIERMADAASADEVMKILQETEYSRSMGANKQPEDFEAVLTTELERVYQEIYRMAKDQELIALLALKYDYQNLKMLLKSSVLEGEANLLLQDMGTIPANELRSDVESENLGEYSPHIQEAVRLAMEDFGKNRDPQRIDMLVDRKYFEHLNSLVSGKRDVDLIRDYVSYQTDMYNLLALMRAKKQDKEPAFLEDLFAQGGAIPVSDLKDSYLESVDNIARKFRNYPIGPALKKGLDAYQATGRLGEMERQMENGMMSIVKPSKRVIFGPEPLFAYVVAKERENKLLRIIMVSKLNNIPPDRIRERLRDIYV
ncbi:V-type sodium ATPase subunit C [anaerobic digester metagenome]